MVVPPSGLHVTPFGHGEEWHWEVVGPQLNSRFRPLDTCCDEGQRLQRQCAGFKTKELAMQDGRRRRLEMVELPIGKAASTQKSA